MIEHRPAPNPDSDDPITFRACAQDETGVASVHLLWTLNGVTQDDLAMYDDGTHGDDWAGDGVWSIQHTPLPKAARSPTGPARRMQMATATATRARTPSRCCRRSSRRPRILFVPDAGDNNTPSDTAWFRSYYTNALEALGYRYDTWDTELRGAPGSAILSQYTHGAVIWAMPYWGYATDYGYGGIGALQAYLDAGGKLFITGQNIAESPSSGVTVTSSTTTCMRPSGKRTRACMPWPARPAIPSATGWR